MKVTRVITNIEREYQHPHFPQVRVIVLKNGKRVYGSEGSGIERPYSHFTTLREARENTEWRG